MGGGYLFDYMFDTRYVGCKFVTKDNEFLFYRDINSTKIFKNCIFGYQTDALATYKLPFYVLMDDVWFGVNKIPKFITPSKSYVIDEDGHIVDDGYVIPVTRYAIFNVTQNYLGNDQYEIIGKLTLNGTDDQDGMENFQLMTVTLESESGGELHQQLL